MNILQKYSKISINNSRDKEPSKTYYVVHKSKVLVCTLLFILGTCFSLTGCTTLKWIDDRIPRDEKGLTQEAYAASNLTGIQNQILADISEHASLITDGEIKPYCIINENRPFFTKEELETGPLEEYSSLDALGRPHGAISLISRETMPTEERGNIGMIKPAGWHTVKYPDVISDLYLYNRCHIIGYQLTGENANEKNLMTGTRFFNMQGMLPFENQVADYVRETGNFVLYRVTPIYANDTDLLAKGVLIEAMSLADDLKFCVFAHNEQPGIQIDYATGKSNLK